VGLNSPFTAPSGLRPDQPSLMLDSNVWRYLVNEGENTGQQLKRAASRYRVQIVACPAVAYEALYAQNAILRRRLIKIITLGAWSRLMPEAYREASELYAVIAQRRPEWLASTGTARGWYRLQADWSGGGWWRRARERPDREASFIHSLGAERLADAREEALLRRQSALSLTSSHNTPLRQRLRNQLGWWPDWLDDDVEPWRVEGMTRWSAALQEDPERTPRDWIDPWIDVPRVVADLKSWISLWTREATLSEFPLHWLRSAMGDIQAVQKVTPGTPVDNQIGTYLPYVDHFVTGDRRFLTMIENLRDTSPVSLARGHLIRADRPALPQLDEMMASLAKG
jgi:hypothetical protein